MYVKNICDVFVIVYSFLVFVDGCSESGWGDLSEELVADLCPVLTEITSTATDLSQVNIPTDEEGPITSELIAECLRCGRELSRASSRRGNKLVKNGINLDGITPSLHHFYSANRSEELKKSSKMSHEIITATKVMQMKLCSSSGVTPNTFMSFLEHQVIQLHDPTYCEPVKINCSNRKYRTIDGTCNNEKHPSWGRRGAPFTRLAAPRYADGIYAMPVARSGRPLPNPRLLSTRLFADRPLSSRVLTYMNMQWGQFVTHDLLFQLMEVTDEGGIQCCLGEGYNILPSEMLNDKCIPICVPDDDPFYRHHEIKCLNFVRSITAPRDDCSFGAAEQMNSVTAFLDGSQIYGSDPKLAKKIRSRKGGKLREEKRKNCVRGFLPSVDNKTAACDLKNSSDPCYLAGDGRINQNPTLALIHTLFLREHNRIADILGSLNPMWSDEKLYQETRRIVIAEIQHITYQEWLPLNFGENYLRYYRITPSTLYSRDYNDDVNPGVINGFGAGAFRFLHSVIPDSIMTCPASYQGAHLYKLSDHYFNPSLLEASPESLDDMVRGILTQSAAESDPFCSGEVTNLLFKSHNKWGLDLVAMDVQRGRDHGIASYNDFREICGLRRARTFQDLSGEISQDRINALAQFYENVNDIDLFVGGAMESDVQGSILGHTFQCIVAEQFYRTRVGDRFFYDHGEMPHSFTPDQLKELKKASMARLICDNTDGVYYVQKKAFELESPYNPRYSCDDYIAIPNVDLTPWKKPTFDVYD